MQFPAKRQLQILNVLKRIRNEKEKASFETERELFQIILLLWHQILTSE